MVLQQRTIITVLLSFLLAINGVLIEATSNAHRYAHTTTKEEAFFAEEEFDTEETEEPTGISDSEDSDEEEYTHPTATYHHPISRRQQPQVAQPIRSQQLQPINRTIQPQPLVPKIKPSKLTAAWHTVGKTACFVSSLANKTQYLNPYFYLEQIGPRCTPASIRKILQLIPIPGFQETAYNKITNMILEPIFSYGEKQDGILGMATRGFKSYCDFYQNCTITKTSLGEALLTKFYTANGNDTQKQKAIQLTRAGNIFLNFTQVTATVYQLQQFHEKYAGKTKIPYCQALAPLCDQCITAYDKFLKGCNPKNRIHKLFHRYATATLEKLLPILDYLKLKDIAIKNRLPLFNTLGCIDQLIFIIQSNKQLFESFKEDKETI